MHNRVRSLIHAVQPLRRVLLCALCATGVFLCGTARSSEPANAAAVATPAPASVQGNDLRTLFARAAKGEPLRAVALGGSITQAGKGWAGPWLKEHFPLSNVSMFNSGMSATGSSLGIFRVGRDVIAHQPDLVFIEYVVNDSGLSDEDAIRFNESLVVRLKSLPNPPAIVFLNVAVEKGSNPVRHQKVARHYGLAEINLQPRMDEYLKEPGAEWGRIMSDAVHPNEAGHKLYAQWIGEALTAYLPTGDAPAESAAGISATGRPALPAPLSSKPLLLDGQMINLATLVNEAGWDRESSLPAWWDQFFTGVLASKTERAVLNINVRGTFLGVFYAMDKSYGNLYASVDGMSLSSIICGSRGGYSSHQLGRDLTPQTHRLRFLLADNRSVKLGYLLVAGDNQPMQGVAAQGPMNDEMMRNFRLQPVKTEDWVWCGPFGSSATVGGVPSADLETKFAPETKPASEIVWKPVAPSEKSIVDVAAMTGVKDRGVAYAKTTIRSEKGGRVLFGFALDYFGKIWVNGELVKTFTAGHGGPNSPVKFYVTLKPGENEVFVKVHAGSQGHSFALFTEDAISPLLPENFDFRIE